MKAPLQVWRLLWAPFAEDFSHFLNYFFFFPSCLEFPTCMPIIYVCLCFSSIENYYLDSITYSFLVLCHLYRWNQTFFFSFALCFMPYVLLSPSIPFFFYGFLQYYTTMFEEGELDFGFLLRGDIRTSPLIFVLLTMFQ